MWARFYADGQLIQTSPDKNRLLCEWKTDLQGFILPGFWTETLSSFERFMSVQVIFRPAPLVLNMLLDF